jgi:hypothetical protein
MEEDAAAVILLMEREKHEEREGVGEGIVN